MEDKIIAGYLRDFSEDYALQSIEEYECFEHFINYCTMSNHIPSNFSLDDVHVGDKANPAIDGAAIVVNGHLVTSKEEVEYFIKTLGKIDVNFIFNQTKRGSKFDMGEIGNFLFGVRDFFEDSPTLTSNKKINDLRDLKDCIYALCIHMQENPKCHTYFATTGKWDGNSTLTGRIDSDLDAIRAFNIFSDITFMAYDADKIRYVYRELKHKVEKIIQFSSNTPLPEIENVTEAYIGILPCSEYLKLIVDSDGNLQKSLFYDNVRDFQGLNPVNEDIQRTISDSKRNSKFGLMNNGVTVVAKSIKRTGNQFKVNDFQIVNGCQTSHIIYLNKEKLSDKLFIPIKLIVTDDIEVTNDIIFATNWQTEVKKEAFTSISPFHKKLEEFFLNLDKDKARRLFYERRSKQYEGHPVPKARIVTLTNQIKSFIAMFLNSPHSTHRYYGEILEANKNKIFASEHSPFPYYVCSYALHKVEQYFLQRKLDPLFKRFKYHMLLLFRIQILGKKMPPLGSKKIARGCQEMMEILWDDQKAIETFEKSIKRIELGLNAISDKKNATRLKIFTSQLTDLPELEFESGIITYYNDLRGYGFIARSEIEGTEDVFVHIHDVEGGDASNLRWGDKVEFLLEKGKKGFVAKKVKIVG